MGKFNSIKQGFIYTCPVSEKSQFTFHLCPVFPLQNLPLFLPCFVNGLLQILLMYHWEWFLVLAWILQVVTPSQSVDMFPHVYIFFIIIYTLRETQFSKSK